MASPLLFKFQFIGGVSPLTMRARCPSNRQFPDPLGDVTASKKRWIMNAFTLPGTIRMRNDYFQTIVRNCLRALPAKLEFEGIW